MFELVDTVGLQAVIKVIGVGGGGGNAVDHMMKDNIEGVDFINANTDAQVLERSTADTTLQLGDTLTKGLGAGADPSVGKQAAMEDRDRIAEAIEGADMLFITAGMGGGTGTGAAPVVAELAREKGILTVAVVTKPFHFEGKKRMALAEAGLEELKGHVDSLIIIPNQKVLEHMGSDASMIDAFAEANQVLLNAVQGISELITRPGMINVDFADVRTVMSEMGMAMMGSATASGANRAEEAARKAISSPLLEDTDLHGAGGLLVNITAGPDLTIGEFSKIGDMMQEFAGDDAVVVIGSAVDPDAQGDLRVTMVATGLGKEAAIAQAATQEPEVQAPPMRNTAAPARNQASVGEASRRQQPEFVPPTPVSPSRNNFEGGARMVGGNGSLDFAELEIPTFLRQQQAD
ncbi:MAG: cell division protein FtsZ [Saprospiraceae bacterium]|jgi:cell division protein FtsZ